MANTSNVSTSNRKSVLLDEQQNSVVLSQLGPRCLSLSTTLTVLSVSIPPEHTSGKIRCSGVLCFVKDYAKRTFFIKIYDPEVKRLVWVRNLADVRSYSQVNPLYHLMQLQIGQAGFHFTNEIEAAHFGRLVEEKLAIRVQREDSKESLEETNEEAKAIAPLYPSLSALDLQLTETSFVLVRSALEDAKRSLLVSLQAKDAKSKAAHRRAPPRPPPPKINLHEQTDDAKLNQQEKTCKTDATPPTPPVRTSSRADRTTREASSDDDYDQLSITKDLSENIPPTPPPVDFKVEKVVKEEESLKLKPTRKAPPVPAPRRCNKKSTDMKIDKECIYQNTGQLLEESS